MDSSHITESLNLFILESNNLYSGNAGFGAASLEAVDGNGSIPHRQELKGYSRN